VGIIPPCKRSLKRVFGIQTQASDTTIAGFELHQQLRKLGITCRAADQAYMRRLFEDPLALLLRHATEHCEGLPLAVLFLELLKTRKDFLLGLISDTAGVIEHQLGLLGRLDLRIALIQEGTHDLLRVVRIHLTPEGLEVKSLHVSL